MTVRVVPLGSPEAGDARVEGSIPERVALVGYLSDMLWTQTGRSRPSYTRATMPIVMTTLRVRSADG
jgi:hypothetical protein